MQISNLNSLCALERVCLQHMTNLVLIGHKFPNYRHKKGLFNNKPVGEG